MLDSKQNEIGKDGKNLEDSIDSSNCPVLGYLPLIQRCASADMYGIAVSVEGLSSVQDLSLENSKDSYLWF